MEKHEITNDFALDAIKDNYKPPMMGAISEDTARELFYRLDIPWGTFSQYVYHHSEYYTDNKKNYFFIKDITKIIKDTLCPQ